MDGYTLGQSRSTSYNEHFISIIRKNVDILCKTIEQVQTIDSPLCSFLDKPDFHRLVDLVYHTIPTFGHVRVITEMPFETVHQALKQSMTRNRYTDKHITGFYHTLFTDWYTRMIQQ